MPTENLQSSGIANAINHRMSYLIARQGLVSGNVANAATPNYLARDLAFNKSLRGQMRIKANHPKHIKIGNALPPSTHMETMDKNIKNNGNSVVVANEMLKLNEIQMNYTLMTRLYAKHAQMQNTALGRQ